MQKRSAVKIYGANLQFPGDREEDGLCGFDFCERPRLNSLSLPVCQDHALKIAAEIMYDQRAQLQYRVLQHQDRPYEPVPNGLRVYYVRLGDRVKIGFSTGVEKRVQSFLTTHATVQLLATEVGDRLLENRRHREFELDRVGRTELFLPSTALLRHVNKMRASAHRAPIPAW